MRLGGKHLDSEGYDLMGLMTGSEGLLGVVTEVTVRLLRKPSTARAMLLGFPTEAGAADCVAAVIASGIIPAGMEMMDKDAVKCAEAYVGAGYPMDAEGLLIVELDGPQVEVDHLVGAGRGDRHASAAPRPCRVSRDEQERVLFWAGRKAAVPRRRPDHARLYVPRRLGAARPAGRGAGRDAPDVEDVRAARGQRLPCRRRQPPPADPVRRQRSRASSSRAEEFGADILRLCVRSAAC